MGTFSMFGGHSDVSGPPNPNPRQFTVLCTLVYSPYTALKVKYHGCTNFEGIKILVVKNFEEGDSVLDPHFSETNNVVARFRPDDQGWSHACQFAKGLSDGK